VPLPAEGVEVHARVPQLAVLAHAAAFVTHAGMGSSAEALWSGVPCVAVPQAVDQFANAARLAELGVGVVLDPARAADPVALRAAVERVAEDPGVRARADAVRAEVRAGGSVARAADLAEAELGAG
jgi:MGT family glycosyltransferase